MIKDFVFPFTIATPKFVENYLLFFAISPSDRRSERGSWSVRCTSVKSNFLLLCNRTLSESTALVDKNLWYRRKIFQVSKRRKSVVEFKNRVIDTISARSICRCSGDKYEERRCVSQCCPRVKCQPEISWFLPRSPSVDGVRWRLHYLSRVRLTHQ